ncbi:MAG: FxLYD domain-containing protein [Bacteroidota bacterium]
MKKIVVAVVMLVAFVACKDEKKEKKFDTESYEKVKESLAEKEQKNPAKFVMVSNHKRKNIIGQTVVIGTLTNRATVCWYKDVEIKLSFFSKTGVKLDEGLETVYENIGPGKTVKFKTKYFAPKGTDSVAVIVTKATGDISNTK